jgi:hypothetical protein
MFKIHNKVNMSKIHKGKTNENELCQKPHKNSLPKICQKLPPPKTPQKLSVHDYTILTRFLLPPLYIFFVFFRATPSNIGENREIALPR